MPNSTFYKVFVYGTLKNGFANHRLMKDSKNGIARFLGRGITKCKFPLVVASSWKVPFMLNKPGTGHNVTGEVYEVDDTMLSVLNKLEHEGVWYDAFNVDVNMKDDDVVEGSNDLVSCMCYVINKCHSHILELEHLQEYTLDYHENSYIKASDRLNKNLYDVIAEVKEVN